MVRAGILRGIMIENVHATGSILTSSITGVPGFTVEDVTLSNIRIDSEEAGNAEWTDREIPEQAKSYPEARMFGRFPAYGLYCRHVDGLRLRQIEFRAAAQEARPAIVCDDVNDVEIAGLRGTAITGDRPTVKLVQTRQALVQGCVAPPKTRTFLDVRGATSSHISLMNCDLSAAEKPVVSGPDVPPGAVRLSGNLT